MLEPGYIDKKPERKNLPWLLLALAFVAVWLGFTNVGKHWRIMDKFTLEELDYLDEEVLKKNQRYLTAFTWFASFFPPMVMGNKDLIVGLARGAFSEDEDLRLRSIRNLTVLALDPQLDVCAGAFTNFEKILESLRDQPNGDPKLLEATARLMYLVSREPKLAIKMANRIMEYVPPMLQHESPYVRADTAAFVLNLAQMNYEPARQLVVPIYELFLSTRGPVSPSPPRPKPVKKISKYITPSVDALLQEVQRKRPSEFKLNLMEVQKIPHKLVYLDVPEVYETLLFAGHLQANNMQLIRNKFNEVVESYWSRTVRDFENLQSNFERFLLDNFGGPTKFGDWFSYLRDDKLRTKVRTHVRCREALRKFIDQDPYILDEVVLKTNSQIPPDVFKEIVWTGRASGYEKVIEEVWTVATPALISGTLGFMAGLARAPSNTLRGTLKSSPTFMALASAGASAALASFWRYNYSIFEQFAEERMMPSEWLWGAQIVVGSTLIVLWPALRFAPFGSVWPTFLTIPSINMMTLQRREMEIQKEDWYQYPVKGMFHEDMKDEREFSKFWGNPRNYTLDKGVLTTEEIEELKYHDFFEDPWDEKFEILEEREFWEPRLSDEELKDPWLLGSEGRYLHHPYVFNRMEPDYGPNKIPGRGDPEDY